MTTKTTIFRHTVLAACATLLISTGITSSQAKGTIYKVGDKVSDFVLKDDAGKKITLSQFKGKVVILNFYASWCPPCNEEAPHLEKEIWQKYKNKNVQVIGIAVQERNEMSKLTKFRKDHGLTYPLALDDPGNIIQKFGFSGIPQAVVINPAGKYISAPNTVEGMESSLKKLVK